MAPSSPARIRRRVVEAAEAALSGRGFVTALDVLVGIRWLPQSAVDAWQQGRLTRLEERTQGDRAKIVLALVELVEWAETNGLQPTEGEYLARSRRAEPLVFSSDGDVAIERAVRVRWVSTDLSDRRKRKIEEEARKPPDLVVISPLKDFECRECGGSGDLLIMEGPGPLCMTCADMDHLVYLPAGNATLTRRARKESGLSAVVVRFSRTRRRYERQGLLVEEDALERAEEQCLADEALRAARRARDVARREQEDEQFQRRFAEEIRRLFPGCPEQRATDIARHTASRGSGRVGRSAAARQLDPKAVELAVAASVRHRDTSYDRLLMSGLDRPSARAEVHPEVSRILDGWRHS